MKSRKWVYTCKKALTVNCSRRIWNVFWIDSVWRPSWKFGTHEETSHCAISLRPIICSYTFKTLILLHLCQCQCFLLLHLVLELSGPDIVHTLWCQLRTAIQVSPNAHCREVGPVALVSSLSYKWGSKTLRKETARCTFSVTVIANFST